MEDDEAADQKETVRIGGAEAVLIEKRGRIKLLWGDNPSFVLYGTCGEQALLKVAESVAKE